MVTKILISEDKTVEIVFHKPKWNKQKSFLFMKKFKLADKFDKHDEKVDMLLFARSEKNDDKEKMVIFLPFGISLKVLAE